MRLGPLLKQKKNIAYLVICDGIITTRCYGVSCLNTFFRRFLNNFVFHVKYSLFDCNTISLNVSKLIIDLASLLLLNL